MYEELAKKLRSTADREERFGYAISMVTSAKPIIPADKEGEG